MRTLAGIIFSATLFTTGAVAQVLPGALPRTDRGDGYHWNQQNLTQDQKDKLADYLDSWRQQRLTPEQKGQHKAASVALVNALSLSCDVTEAVPRARGPATINGRTVDTLTYEVACGNGMGYFLVSQAPENPYGLSCFTAEATREADMKAGRDGAIVCGLPQNADLNAAAATVLSRSRIVCAVNGHKLIGQNAKAHLEFVEVSCSNGPGYILVTALPGSPASPGAMSCDQAAAKGLTCTLAANAVAAAKP